MIAIIHVRNVLSSIVGKTAILALFALLEQVYTFAGYTFAMLGSVSSSLSFVDLTFRYRKSIMLKEDMEVLRRRCRVGTGL